MSHPSGLSLGERLAVPLWVMWAGLLFGGMVLAGYERFDSDPFLKATRLASSLLLVMTGFVITSSPKTSRPVWPLLMIALGMAFGFLGDYLQFRPPHQRSQASDDGWHRHLRDRSPLLHGQLSLDSKQQGLRHPNTWWGSIIVWQLIGLAGWFVVIFTDTPLTPVHWAALPYCLLLAGTAGMTCGLALADRRYFWLGLGGALFLASDLVLAIQLFRDDIDIAAELARFTGVTSEAGHHFMKQISRHACWLLYGPAQMLIVFSGLSLLAVEKNRAVDESISSR